MPVHQANGRVILTHPKGSSVELLLYGATVISWKAGTIPNPEPNERLFVSSKAALDGSKPVRGGIPVVFPCFGAPTHPEHSRLGQHGFARSEAWTFDSIVMDNAAGVSVRLTLGPTPSIRAKYDRPFHLAYVVTLAEHQLTTDLHVTNPSASTAYPPDNLEFQALFHNYFRAPANEILVFKLQNNKYYDKTEATEEGRNNAKVETRAGVDVRKFTDSVYEDASQEYEVTWPGGGVEIRAKELKDVVVWNPQLVAGIKLADMEDGGWEKFVCVEPGYVRGFAKVEPGKTWIGRQVMSVIHHERRINQL
ncbi:galactose mutarotase-like domain-containing protein [Melanogaster broomeanus]|nr:galactose mutarotase-like domain-containing protein [Melanogaster broomeanus]